MSIFPVIHLNNGTFKQLSSKEVICFVQLNRDGGHSIGKANNAFDVNGSKMKGEMMTSRISRREDGRHQFRRRQKKSKENRVMRYLILREAAVQKK